MLKLICYPTLNILNCSRSQNFPSTLNEKATTSSCLKATLLPLIVRMLFWFLTIKLLKRHRSRVCHATFPYCIREWLMMKSLRLDEDGSGSRGDSKSFIMIVYCDARAFHSTPTESLFICPRDCPLGEMMFRITRDAFAFISNEKDKSRPLKKLIQFRSDYSKLFSYSNPLTTVSPPKL